MEQYIPILPLRTRKQIATVLHLLFLMIGGVSLSIAVGRLIRMGISRLQFR